MADSVRPHRRQPTRLPHPWDSPGKNTGVGCHFLLQCVNVKSESEVAQSCPTLCDPMDYTVRGVLPARTLERVALPFFSRTKKKGVNRERGREIQERGNPTQKPRKGNRQNEGKGRSQTTAIQQALGTISQWTGADKKAPTDTMQEDKVTESEMYFTVT